MALRQVHPVEFQPPEPEMPASSPSNQSDARVLAVLRAIAMILGAKLVLLMGLLGAFVMALLAVFYPTWGSLTAAGLYEAFVFIPLLLFVTRGGWGA